MAKVSLCHVVYQDHRPEQAKLVEECAWVDVGLETVRDVTGSKQCSSAGRSLPLALPFTVGNDLN